MNPRSAFVLGPAALPARRTSVPRTLRPAACAKASSDPEPECCRIRRRAVLGAGLASLLGSTLFAPLAQAADARGAQETRRGRSWKQAEPGDEDVKCKNCVGTGKVPCDLCSGTGFWRALANNDRNQKYQGVVCPECEGEGTLRCSVCLGTGDGNVRGLLRRRRIEPGPGRILQTNSPEDDASAAKR